MEGVGQAIVADIPAFSVAGNQGAGAVIGNKAFEAVDQNILCEGVVGHARIQAVGNVVQNKGQFLGGITGRLGVFQICFTDPNQGVASADYIAENALATKIGVIYDSSDAYSSGIYAKFKTEAESKGLEIVTAEAFTSDNKSDLSTQVAKCQEAGAELVFLPIYYTPASVILTQANAMGYEPTFFGVDGMDGILGVDGFDTSLAEGLMLLTPFAADAQDEKTQAFVSAYVAAYGETPNQFAADAYDVIYSMYQAVLETGVTGDMDASEICEQLKTGYTSMIFDGLTGTGMTWDASGAVSKDPKAVVIKDGAYAAM